MQPWGLFALRLRHRFLPNRRDTQFLLLVDQARQVEAQQLAQRLIHHRHGRLAAHRVTKLPLDGRERAFDVAAQVVVLQELVALELEVVEHLLEQPADAHPLPD